MNACCDRDKVPVENSLCPATIITISPSPLLQNIKPLFIGRVLRLKSTDWEETYYFPWETKSREKAFASLWEITRRGGTLHPARPHDCQCMKLSSSGFPFVVVCVGGRFTASMHAGEINSRFIKQACYKYTLPTRPTPTPKDAVVSCLTAFDSEDFL